MTRLSVSAFATIFMLSAATGPVGAAPNFKCDPLDPVADAGWSVVPSLETVGEADGVPYQDGADWFVDRTTTSLPFCNYYNDIGIYSMRSYTLSRQVSTQRIAICKGGAAVSPYAGPCPPR
jgi:hypothetical protein